MSWGSAGFPSPRMRRTSRPLSMICEIPDDATGSSKGNATTHQNNGTAKREGGLHANLSPSSKLSRAIPTRRKAVAPLQHPVVVLLDKHSDSINSNDNSLPSNQKRDQKKIQIPETTSTVSSIIKRFSSMNDSNTTSYDNSNNKESQQFVKVSHPHNFKQVTKKLQTANTNGDADSGITSENINSPKVLDRNHNNLFQKSYNRHCIENSEPPNKTSDSVDVCPDTTCQNMLINTNIKLNSSTDISMNEKELRIVHNDEDTCVLHRYFVHDTDMSLGSESSGDSLQHEDLQSEKEEDGDVCNINSSNNYNHQEISYSTDTLQEEDKGSHICNTPNNTASLRQEHRCLGIAHCHSIKSINLLEGNAVFDRSNDSQSIDNTNFHFLTSTPNCKSTTSSTQFYQHSFHRGNPFPLHNIQNTSAQPKDDSQAVTHVVSEPKHPHRTSKDDIISNPNTQDHLLHPDQQTETSPSLDGETLEWKKRVKRSVSLIKSPNVSELTGQTRRTSSIHSPIHYSDSTSENEHRLHYHNSNNNTNNPILSDDSNQNNDSEVTDESINSEPIRRISSIDQSDFSLLKVATTRLNLPTRRPSVTAWKEKYLNKNGPHKFLPSTNIKENLNSSDDSANVFCETDLLDNRLDTKEWKITEDVENRINHSLAWLRRELIDIRILDQSLARQFLNLREAMNAFRLAVECEGHQELIKDAEEDMKEIRELSQLVDIPPEMFSPLTPLKHVGITRMNISSRRFSTC